MMDDFNYDAVYIPKKTIWFFFTIQTLRFQKNPENEYDVVFMGQPSRTAHVDIRGA